MKKKGTEHHHVPLRTHTRLVTSNNANCMEQSPSLDAERASACQEISLML